MHFKYELTRIYLENDEGKTIAEVTFPNISDDVVNVNHTYVDQSLRGQGMASKLMSALVTELKINNKKATATCPYAIDWFENHSEYKDIYLNSANQIKYD